METSQHTVAAGLGRPGSDGFGATADDYAAWLVGELETGREPVDLVGHDCGGGHVARVARLTRN